MCGVAEPGSGTTRRCREDEEARRKREEEEAERAAREAEEADQRDREDFEARLRDRDLEERARRRGGKHVEEDHEALADKLDLQNKSALVSQLRLLSEQVYLEKRQEKELAVRPQDAMSRGLLGLATQSITSLSGWLSVALLFWCTWQPVLPVAEACSCAALVQGSCGSTQCMSDNSEDTRFAVAVAVFHAGSCTRAFGRDAHDRGCNDAWKSGQAYFQGLPFS